jgi:transcriptional regulator with XRE-family HTH domain
MILYREALGYVLKNRRTQRAQTLREVSVRAPIALGYLSEVERGQKEISSELLATVATALGTTLGQLVLDTAGILLDSESIETATEKLLTDTVIV